MKKVWILATFMLIVVIGHVADVGASPMLQVLSCVDFTTYAEDTNFGSNVSANGLTFSTLGGDLFANTVLNQVGLQFTNNGMTVDFPQAVTQVEMEVAAFGNIDFEAIDSIGNIIDKSSVQTDHMLHTVKLTGPDIVQIVVLGGGNEGVLFKICTDLNLPPIGCISFEDQKLGATYAVGDTFVDAGVTALVEDFETSSGQHTTQGHAEIQNGGIASGTDNEIELNNVNLHFALNATITHLTLKFGEYGGNLNIMINGKFINFDDFAEIDGKTIGNVNVNVVNGFGQDSGEIMLDGSLGDFSIGGQELWIDDVCITICNKNNE